MINNAKTFTVDIMIFFLVDGGGGGEESYHTDSIISRLVSQIHKGDRDNCFSKIQLVGQKYRYKTTLASKTRFSRHCLGFQSRRFSLLVGYNI